jgi:hypothetical protein
VAARGSVRELEDLSARSPESSLRLFCRRVAGVYAVNAAPAKPANLMLLTQFLAVQSDSYFFRICDLIRRSTDDVAVRRANEQHRERWQRLLSIRVLGDENEHVRRLIATLELQRLLIEFAFAESIFGSAETQALVRTGSLQG